MRDPIRLVHRPIGLTHEFYKRREELTALVRLKLGLGRRFQRKRGLLKSDHPGILRNEPDNENGHFGSPATCKIAKFGASSKKEEFSFGRAKFQYCLRVFVCVLKEILGLPKSLG